MTEEYSMNIHNYISKFSKIYLSLRLCSCSQNPKEYSNKLIKSTLFQHDTDFVPTVKPNFDNFYFQNLLKNCEDANLNIDFCKIKSLLTEIENIENDLKWLLEKKKLLVKKYLATSDKNILESHGVRNKIKNLKASKTNLKSELLLSILSIPNVLSHKPIEDWNLISRENQNLSYSNHFNIGPENLNDIKIQNFNDISLKFFHGSLSFIKWMVMETSHDWWSERNYIPISLSDISKTPIVECCNNELLKHNIAIINSHINSDDHCNHFHVLFLKGSGTIEAFCSYFMRTVVNNKSLPVKLVTLGNKYTNSGAIDQTSVISVMIAASTEQVMLKELKNLQNDLKKFWLDHFDVPIIADIENRQNLKNWEGFRYIIRTNNSQPVTLSSISVIGDYISRRLMIKDLNENNLHMVYAEVLNFDALLSYIENSRQEIIFNYDSQW